MMASIVIWLIGFLFFGLGCWILVLRIEGVADLIRPNNLSIGQITIDGQEGRGYAELLRARYDHHLRRPASLAIESGLLGVVTLDTPELFQPKTLDAGQKWMTIEVKGVDVPKLIQLVDQIFQPDQWVIEGDFQTHLDRVLLILRLRRGERLVRTWYLDRYGDLPKDKSKLVEQLIDDAIFQLVYDFGNKSEHDADIIKWRSVVNVPTNFPNRASLAAYYEALGALGRYYAHGDWHSLNRAIDCLQTLRGLMPKYEDGLQLLGMALVEKRNDVEAIHVYEQLQLLWKDENWADLTPQRKRRQFSIDLLKATAKAKLYTWQSTHEALHELLELYKKLQPEYEKLRAKQPLLRDDKEVTAYNELLAHTAVQTAYTYSLYLSYMRHYMVADIFRHSSVPEGLGISQLEEEELRKKDGKPKPIVISTVKKVAGYYEEWIKKAKQVARDPDMKWDHLVDGERRKAEFISRLHLASGYASYRMAELENSSNGQSDTILGETFDTRLAEAEKELRGAEATHPNHYLSLQLLGLVYSEPRRKDDFSDLSIAEQYFERAILMNPSDYYGHELLAEVLYRRAANGGVELMDRAMIERGFAEAQKSTDLRDSSGNAYLLQAEFQTMLLEMERDSTRRHELQKELKQYLEQAKRFLPRTYEENPDLMWVSIVADTLLLGESALLTAPKAKVGNNNNLFIRSKKEVIQEIDSLIDFCADFEQKWVAHQRIFQVKRLGERAKVLRGEIEKATPADWHEIKIPFR